MQPFETLYSRTAGSPVIGLGEKIEVLCVCLLLCILTWCIIITDIFRWDIANGSYSSLGNQSQCRIGWCKSELQQLKIWYQEFDFLSSPSSLFPSFIDSQQQLRPFDLFINWVKVYMQLWLWLRWSDIQVRDNRRRKNCPCLAALLSNMNLLYVEVWITFFAWAECATGYRP